MNEVVENVAATVQLDHTLRKNHLRVPHEERKLKRLFAGVGEDAAPEGAGACNSIAFAGAARGAPADGADSIDEKVAEAASAELEEECLEFAEPPEWIANTLAEATAAEAALFC